MAHYLIHAYDYPPIADKGLTAAMCYAVQEAAGTYGIVGLSSTRDAAEFRATGMYVARPYPVVLAAGVEGAVRVDFFDSDLDNLW